MHGKHSSEAADLFVRRPDVLEAPWILLAINTVAA